MPAGCHGRKRTPRLGFRRDGQFQMPIAKATSAIESAEPWAS
jgi:hypothetical protein